MPRVTLDWMDRASCAEIGPEIFFPDLGVPADAVRSVCRSCEVRAECLGYALRNGERDGIFGGFTDRPRRKIARRVAAGESLEDIIAEDDARFYSRLAVAS